MGGPGAPLSSRRVQNRRRRRVGLALAASGLAGLVVSGHTPLPFVEPAAAAPPPASITLTPTDDAFVSPFAPTTNFGSADHFDVYGGLTPEVCTQAVGPSYGLLRFDVSSIPAGSVVTGARLVLTSRAGFAQDGDSNHHVIWLPDGNFDEDTVTWANRPDDGTVSWLDSDAPLGTGELRGGGNIVSSDNAVGSRFVFRNTCTVDPAGDEGIFFPGNALDQSKSVTASATDLAAAINSVRGGEWPVMTFEVFNLNYTGDGPGEGYWARYHSKEAADPAVRPRLVLTFAQATAFRAVPAGAETVISAAVNAPPGSTSTLRVFTSNTCTGGELGTPVELDGIPVTAGADGSAYVTATVAGSAAQYVAVMLEGTDGGLTAPSPCIVAGPDNDVWTRALTIPLSGGDPATGSATGYLDTPGGARWYRFPVQAGGRVTVSLSGMDVDADLALFGDIGAAFSSAESAEDLYRIGAEYAPSVFSPSVFSPSVFSPSVFSPDAYSPSVFSPSVFSPSVFSPSVFSPSVFSPSVFSPSVFSPSVFSPSVFSPAGTDAFDPEAFASAQTRSLLGFASTRGPATETVSANTWNSTGFYYVRVTGFAGAADEEQPFTVSVERDDLPECVGVSPIGGSPSAAATGVRTVILTDPDRFEAGTGNAASDLTALDDALGALAARPEVAGVVVDVGADPRVAALRAQADAHPGCPFAQNLVAGAIKDVVDAHRAASPELQYVVLIGGDDNIPFFRYPDEALLGPESGYVPPVADGTPSQASLRLDYVLGQDEYGSATSVELGGQLFPLPDLAVGRLVETAAEITAQIGNYLTLDGGVAPAPSNALVTGYDFLEDAADSVAADLRAGLGGNVTELVTPAGVSPQDPESWTADDLRNALLGSRHDLVYLAGHFSANSALAADFATSVLTTELEASPVDLVNAVVFSAGCHSAYNIVDEHAVAGLTEPLDWAQAFARKGAVLIGGTGYQYGDTDFLEYSERIYAGFATQLRYGDGPVSVGEALVASKLDYLSSTTDIRGLHRKALLISTVYGLPMLSVDLPEGRLARPADTPLPISPAGYAEAPGSVLGLSSADVTFGPSLTDNTVELTNLDGGTLTASYLSGPDGVVTNPAEPAVPLQNVNVTVPGTVLRGVGFRGGPYTDETVVPLTGAPTTELRGVHAPFASTSFFPMRLATINQLGALAGTGGGTRLLVTPVQHKVASIGDVQATRRTFTALAMRLFYSDRLGQVALSDAPTIGGITALVDGDDIVFGATVVGNPSAGVQEVWVTYTGDGPQRWAPVDLVQCTEFATPAECPGIDSTRWVGRLPGAAGAAASIRFVVQAVNGVGLVTLDDAFGAYHSVSNGEQFVDEPAPSALTFVGAPGSGRFGTRADVTVELTVDGTPAANRSVTVGLGGVTRAATTGADGRATVSLPLSATPGGYDLVAGFTGDPEALPAAASAPFTITTSPTSLSVTGTPDSLTAVLTDAGGAPIGTRTVTFELSNGVSTVYRTAITDLLGVARVPNLGLAGGTWTVTARFLGTVTTPAGTVTTTDAVYQASVATTQIETTAPPTIEGTPPGATAGSAYSFGYVVGGGATVTVTDGALPPGLTVSAEGVLSGVPTTAGTYTFTLTAANASGDASTISTVVVAPGAVASLTVTGGDNQVGTLGLPFDLPLTVAARDAYGNPVPGVTVTFTVTSGRAAFATSPATATTDATGSATSPRLTAGTRSGPVVITATAGPLSTTFNASVISLTAARSDIAVTLAAPASAARGATFQVSVTLTNLGPNTAALPAAALTVGSGARIVSASGGTVVLGTAWGAGAPSLAVGATLSYTLTVRAPTRTTPTTLALVGASLLTDPVRSNNTVSRTVATT